MLDPRIERALEGWPRLSGNAIAIYSGFLLGRFANETANEISAGMRMHTADPLDVDDALGELLNRRLVKSSRGGIDVRRWQVVE